MSESKGVLVAIDGPAGSGKSTVSRLVAKRLGIAFLDTGAMYRGLTLASLRRGIPLDDVGQVLEEADQMKFRFEGTVDDPRFYLGDDEVTTQIREIEVAQNVSTVAGLIPVREWMAEEQRRQMLAARECGIGMVAEGRDVATVVCPDADVKVLLLADPEARVRRRTLEMYGEVTPELLEKTRSLVEGRDQIDSLVSEFLKPAEGVTVVDSSDMTIDEVVDTVIGMVPKIEG
ncbi:MAG: (d)CMP kinase [Scrofimicrobium sp.]